VSRPLYSSDVTYLLCLLWLVLRPAVVLGEEPGAQRLPRALAGLRVDLKVLPEVIPRGGSVPVEFMIENASDQELPLEMDHNGHPVYLGSVVRPDGEPYGKPARFAVVRVPVGFDVTPEPELYFIKPGERIRFHRDLALQYDLRGAPAGRYRLQFESQDGARSEGGFTLVDYRTIQNKPLRGGYDTILQLPYTKAMGEVGVLLSLIESVGTDRPFRWLLVDEISVFGVAQTDLPGFWFPVSETAGIETAQMDVFGQIWVLVRSHGQRSLLLWRLHELKWSVLVAPTDRIIEFGTSRAREGIPNQNIVIAGVEGEEKFTTQSVWSMPRAQPAPAPTTTAPAKPAP
jgi:hypothetical protein